MDYSESNVNKVAAHQKKKNGNFPQMADPSFVLRTPCLEKDYGLFFNVLHKNVHSF